jgi:hypothetical protein
VFVNAKDLQCLKLNENQTENARYLPRNLVFTFCRMCKKLMVLGALALKVCKKYYYDPTKIFCKK